jgi:outer membrane autotransporter protein
LNRSISAVLAAIMLLACASLAYGGAMYFDDPAVTRNQRAIGEYFNDIYVPIIDPVSVRIDAVYLAGTAGYLSALDNLSPEGYMAFVDINLGSFSRFNALTMGHLAALRSPSTLAREAKPLYFADSGAIMLDTAPILYAPVAGGANGWGMWGETFGVFGYQANRGGEYGYDYDTYGLALGVDRAVGDTFVFGLVSGYSHSRVDFNDVSLDGVVNSFDLGVYGSYNPGAWYLDASFTWTHNWQDTERYDLFALATAEAQYHGDLFAWYVGGGYNVDIGKARITPAASLTYAYYNQPRFMEDGADLFNLHVHRFDSSSLVSRIGLKFAYEFDLDNVTIVPEASAEWAHEYLSDRSIVARLGSIDGEIFAVDGVKTDRNGALLGLGVTAYFGKGFSAYGDYNADLREHYNSHGFTIGLRYEF